MRAWAVLAGLLTAASAAAQTPMQLGLSSSAEVNAGPGLSTEETVGIRGTSTLFEAAAQLQINGDGKYGADIANFNSSKSFFNNYFYLDYGFMVFRLNPVQVQLGRFAHSDLFESPYNLFLNSAHFSSNGLRVHYEDGWFAYDSQWIELNNRSDFGLADTPPGWAWVWDGSAYVHKGTGFPDRGANLKTFLFKFGSLRVGLQDAGVYTGRNFDAEYFLSPMPAYFTQYVKNTAGRPWTTGGNENNLLGFFVDYTQPTYTLGLQALFDDFSLHFLFPSQVPNNPWKAAWTFGGRFQTDLGGFGVYTAGALKYTFEPISTAPGQDGQSAYGYTWYPEVQYSVGGSKFRTLAITDNALGYQYGENNLALRVTFDRPLAPGLKLATNVELLIAGANSPANPWQDATASNDVGTHWLDDPVLERAVVWTADLRWTLGDWDLWAVTRLGYVGNVLTLQDPTGSNPGGAPPAGWSALDNGIKIFKPSASGQAMASLSLGGAYHLDVSALQRSLTGRR